MGTSLADRARRRAGLVAAAIRQALAAGDGYAAFNEADRALRGEVVKILKQRPADAQLTCAELAGSLAGIAARLHAYNPAGRRLAAVPAPPDLLARFEASVATTRQERESDVI